MNERTRTSTGILLASMAGFGWGSMGVAGQYLMQDGGFAAIDLVAARLFWSGVILLALEAAAGRKVFRPLKNLANARDVAVYGIGLLVIQFTFFLAIFYSNAGLAAIIVMTVPLFVIVYLAVAEKRGFMPREIIALVLAIAGVAVVVTRGDFTSLDFSFAGVLWALASSVGGAFCTLQPKRVIARLSVGLVAGWGMLIGGTILCLFAPPWKIEAEWTLLGGFCYAYIVVVGTAGAFWCYLKSQQYVSPAVSSLMVGFEPLSAVLLSVILLGVVLTPMEIIGSAAIFSTPFILSGRKKRAKGEELHHAGGDEEP